MDNKTQPCSSQSTQRFCCCSFTWSGMTSKPMVANVSQCQQTLGRYNFVTDMNKLVHSLQFTTFQHISKNNFYIYYYNIALKKIVKQNFFLKNWVVFDAVVVLSIIIQYYLCILFNRLWKVQLIHALNHRCFPRESDSSAVVLGPGKFHTFLLSRVTL